jgi:hypothetical protein
MKSFSGGELLRRGTIIFAGIILLLAQLMEVSYSNAQTHKRRRPKISQRKAPIEKTDAVESTITAICKERVQDPQGTLPIDQMAVQRELPLTDQRVIAGMERAERLLPVVKKLVPLALNRLAASHDLEAMSLNWIITRVEAVNTIKAEVDERDNSAWRPSEPRAIIFGTIFLAGLRSDEAMITVLAHELTHAINGTDQALQPLIMRVRTKASQMNDFSVGEDAAVELTCERVGIQVVREYIARSSSRGTIRRRLARALEKDCVSRDLADENHLSPRRTMRVLLKLEPELTRAIGGGGKVRHSKRKRRG